MNLIYEKAPGVSWYSDLQPFVVKLGARINDYWWRFDEVDTTIELPQHAIAIQCWVLTGHELASLVQNHPQFMWAVVSAISTNLEKSTVARPVEIYADGNPNFWYGSPTPQHPDAAFEIVCWDANAWTDDLGDPPLVMALLDRVVDGAIVIQFLTAIDRQSSSAGETEKSGQDHRVEKR